MKQELFVREEPLRVRELALSNGMSYPSNAELIMMILGSGTKSAPIEVLADRVLAVIESANHQNLVSELQRLEGIGRSKALMIAAALELGRRMNRTPQAVVNKPSEVVPFVLQYALSATEHFLCVTLNGAREMIAIHVICSGAGNMALVHPRDVFCEAIKERASAVVLCHNHPSGHKQPSDADIMLTKNLVELAGRLGIAILDHLILTKQGYFSFLEHGLLPIY